LEPAISANGVTAHAAERAAEKAAGSHAFRVVAIGGGTGLSTLLRGLRGHVSAPGESPTTPSAIAELAAVVTVTDDGGSSGRLRQDFNMLPPGDLRNCMVALSEEEDLLTKLFSHRFGSGFGLKGHSFGNLFVAALTEITGDFAQAVQLASKILATRGRIYPATTANTTLIASMDDGSIVRGETKITASKRRIVELTLDPPRPAPMPETLLAIKRADLITVGPGSLYTSLITNLLVDGVPEALATARGVRVYISNLMTQANESLGLTAAEHIERIYDHTRRPIFDFAIVNTRKFSPDTLSRYAAQGAAPIIADVERIEALGVRCVTGDFAGEDILVRHRASRLADVVLDLAQAGLARHRECVTALRGVE
jgi:uncharacterized cofD-like protein